MLHSWSGLFGTCGPFVFYWNSNINSMSICREFIRLQAKSIPNLNARCSKSIINSDNITIRFAIPRKCVTSTNQRTLDAQQNNIRQAQTVDSLDLLLGAFVPVYCTSFAFLLRQTALFSWQNKSNGKSYAPASNAHSPDDTLLPIFLVLCS